MPLVRNLYALPSASVLPRAPATERKRELRLVISHNSFFGPLNEELNSIRCSPSTLYLENSLVG